MEHKVKVVIIGAGISGIGAANCLISAGFDDFVILEADKRVGGRIHSVDLETDPSHRVELGANWIHGNDLNPIYKIATANNLLSTQYEGRHLGRKMLFLTESGEPVNTRYVQDVDLHYGMLIGECEDFYKNEIPTPMEKDSIGAFVEREFEEKIGRHRGRERKMRQMMCSQRLAAECMICGADSMYDVSLSEAGCFEDLPGIHYVIPPGFETILDILSRDIPKEKILLEHQVSRIQWDRAGDENSSSALVECTNGVKYSADIVLVTVSLGYLKAHGARLFDPALPKTKQGAISRVAMGTVDKVILEFDGQVLPDEVFRLETVWDRESWAEDDAEKRRENIANDWVRKFAFFEAVSDNVLVGWLSGMEAEHMEKLSEEEIGSACVKLLTRFLSKTTPSLPQLKKVSRSTWKTNQFSLGSYCHIPVGATAEDIVTLSNPVSNSSNKDVLLFAGEATHPTFYSSSHGALLTGRREAERILSKFNISSSHAVASSSLCRTPER